MKCGRILNHLHPGMIAAHINTFTWIGRHLWGYLISQDLAISANRMHVGLICRHPLPHADIYEYKTRAMLIYCEGLHYNLYTLLGIYSTVLQAWRFRLSTMWQQVEAEFKPRNFNRIAIGCTSSRRSCSMWAATTSWLAQVSKIIYFSNFINMFGDRTLLRMFRWRNLHTFSSSRWSRELWARGVVFSIRYVDDAIYNIGLY